TFLYLCANSDAVSLFSSAVIQTIGVPHHISLTVVEPGDNLTLTCKVIGKEIGLFYWYKLNFGYMIQIIASGSFTKITLQGQFKNPRFNVRKVGDLHSLIIRNISKEDEATYFCQAGAAYLMKFINGTNLAVNDHKNQKMPVHVKQSPETASVQLGASMTLQCSLLYTNKESRAQCPGEHSVHWFRAGSGGFHPGIIYTHSNRSDEQEERSCVYSLSKTIQNSSDAGTYYCAVVTCGEILFGEGTKVETTLFFRSTLYLDVTAIFFNDGDTEALNYSITGFVHKKRERRGT
uniref:Ig-like domain-containing protein n=1 Tax=Seriola lalandi dorsalis TaxID=1841481 RepID=A0A3B4YUN7_SERLL